MYGRTHFQTYEVRPHLHAELLSAEYQKRAYKNKQNERQLRLNVHQRRTAGREPEITDFQKKKKHGTARNRDGDGGSTG